MMRLQTARLGQIGPITENGIANLVPSILRLSTFQSLLARSRTSEAYERPSGHTDDARISAFGKEAA
jgi:hypothetical protein